jgi:hypothetical protein
MEIEWEHMGTHVMGCDMAGLVVVGCMVVCDAVGRSVV